MDEIDPHWLNAILFSAFPILYQVRLLSGEDYKSIGIENKTTTIVGVIVLSWIIGAKLSKLFCSSKFSKLRTDNLLEWKSNFGILTQQKTFMKPLANWVQSL